MLNPYSALLSLTTDAETLRLAQMQWMGKGLTVGSGAPAAPKSKVSPPAGGRPSIQ